MWSGEVRLSGTGRLRGRLYIDSEPVVVELARGGGTWRTASATFTATNLVSGSHNTRLQVAVDSGTTATIRDRTLRVLHKERSGSELARGLPGTSTRPRHQSATVLVICFDPVRTGHPRPSRAQVRGHFQGTDGNVNLEDWLIENSGGHHDLGWVMYRGCNDGAWYTAPSAHQGSYYWDLDDKFVTMRADVLAAVDPNFDFHTWDWNGDGELTREELTTYVVIPQGPAIRRKPLGDRLARWFCQADQALMGRLILVGGSKRTPCGRRHVGARVRACAFALQSRPLRLCNALSTWGLQHYGRKPVRALAP